MLYLLYLVGYEEGSILSFLRLFNYITVRAIFAAITAFFISLAIGERAIGYLRELKVRNAIWDHAIAPEEHKVGIPTMGGILILIGFLVPLALWCNPLNGYTWLVGLAAVWFGLLGGMDDYKKLSAGNKTGLSEKQKLLAQFAFAAALAVILCAPALSPYPSEITGSLFVPFYKFPIESLPLRFAIIVLAVMGASNAVNLADGLDGLAIVPVVLTAGVMGIFTYAEGNAIFAEYLNLPHLPGIGEITIACACLMGAGVGFLWFNCYPAQVFMGDLGSLALGGILGVIAACAKQELLLVVAGGLFVLEALSTLIQRYIFIDRVGRRLFFRAPLHHDLQYRGWSEPKVVVRLWILSAIFALLALATIKIR